MNYTKIISLGLLGGVIAWFLLLSLPGSGPFVFNLIRDDLANYLGEEPALTPTPTVVTPDFWQKIVADHTLSTVAVQSFKDGKIVREGSGVIISSDGVIITTFDVISGADVLQVFHNDRILRAQLVRYDGFKNLALLKVNATDMSVARLGTSYQFQSGQDVIISGKLVELSNSTALSQRGMISQVLSRDIILDTKTNYYISGAKAINNSGIVVGMVYLRSGEVRLVKAEIMDDFIKTYFDSI